MSIVETLRLLEPFADHQRIAVASVINVKYERRVKSASRLRRPNGRVGQIRVTSLRSVEVVEKYIGS